MTPVERRSVTPPTHATAIPVIHGRRPQEHEKEHLEALVRRAMRRLGLEHILLNPPNYLLLVEKSWFPPPQNEPGAAPRPRRRCPRCSTC